MRRIVLSLNVAEIFQMIYNLMGCYGSLKFNFYSDCLFEF